jgi:hypothetical protein
VSRQNVVDIVSYQDTGRTTWESWFDCRQRPKMYLFCKASRSVLGLTQSSVSGKKDSPRPKADYSLYFYFLKGVPVYNFPYYSCNNAAQIGLLNGMHMRSQYNSCVFLFQVELIHFLTTTISVTAQNPLVNWRGIQMLCWISNLRPVNGSSSWKWSRPYSLSISIERG